MPEYILKNTTAVITGAAGGIGQATAKLFANEGARVALVDLDSSRGESLANALQDDGNEALFISADVTNSSQVAEAFDLTEEKLGAPDILVNIVGVSGRKWGDGPVADCTEEAWVKLMDINLKSMFLCCKYGVQKMLHHGGGSVVNISSVLGMVGGDEDFATHAYATTKGGIISLTRSIATYYAGKKIRANAVCPGLIATPMSQRAQSSEKIINKLSQLQPLTADFGQPEDVANAALFLASPMAEFITGAVLPVDGGWTAK
ncbi:MAG: SDR family oxidoreductase [Candidatus Marinimicrobia bacterium]|nr:SDR family oxidoreductase [Candidatus Neomarinimicrobiota bacterium]